MRPRLALAVLVVLAACSDSPTSAGNGVVSVTRDGAALLIRNMSDTPRAYLAYDRDFMALASASEADLIALCTTVDSACLRLPPQETLVVPLTDVGGYRAATKAIILWTWRVLPAGGGQNEAILDDTIELKL